MKKLFIIFAVLCLAAPAIAADWNFYGSARMTTFYEDSSKEVTGTGFDDQELTWAMQGNSRVGANVNVSDNVRGRFEYGTGVNVRLLYGVWDFGAGKLLLGQDYSPMAVYNNNQVWGSDNDMVGYGAFHERTPQIKAIFGGFRVALLAANTNNLGYADTDAVLPKIEASYKFSTDMFNVKVLGGYQTYDVVDATDHSESVDSFVYGVTGGVNFGPVYINANVLAGTNVANFFGSTTYGAYAAVNGTTIEDNKYLAACGAVGFKASDSFSFEGGVGYASSDPDYGGLNKDDQMVYYVNATIGLAPGVFIVPEVGFFDYGDNSANPQVDEGDMTYFGAKWQINF